MGYKSYRPYHNPSKDPQICRICKIEKPATHFWKESRKKNGLRSACRKCERKNNTQFIDINREKVNAKNREHARQPKYRYTIAICRARQKQLSFTLSYDQYAQLISKPCHYCNGKLNETACGLDRTDNSQGYIFGNVVPCCKECNEIKGDTLTYDEAVITIKTLTDYRRQKKEVKDGLFAYSQLI